MSGREINLNEQPTTPPPDPNKPYVYVGNGEWLLLATDKGDGITDADFNFKHDSGKS